MQYIIQVCDWKRINLYYITPTILSGCQMAATLLQHITKILVMYLLVASPHWPVCCWSDGIVKICASYHYVPASVAAAYACSVLPICSAMALAYGHLSWWKCFQVEWNEVLRDLLQTTIVAEPECGIGPVQLLHWCVWWGPLVVHLTRMLDSHHPLPAMYSNPKIFIKNVMYIYDWIKTDGMTYF